MPYPRVTDPVGGPAAFRGTDAELAQAQAAVLLSLGCQLRGDDAALRARASATGAEGAVDTVPQEDLAEFPIPRIGTTGWRFRADTVRERLFRRYEPAGVPPFSTEALSDLGERIYDEPTPVAAAALMEVCMEHPDELVRVSAAASYFELSLDPVRLSRILERGTRSPDELVRKVAAVALARVAPESPRLRALERGAHRRPGAEPGRGSLLVHGTFARGEPWWQPGGDFHGYLKAEVRPDLYSAPDRYDWSGGYSDRARQLAADDLSRWVRTKGQEGLDLFTHSHGGSVAMLANMAGLELGTLLPLSCPVHLHKYRPDFARIRRVVSVRVRMDLVILADRGGQRFRGTGIEENVLPLWFDHSATHYPAVWKARNVPSMI